MVNLIHSLNKLIIIYYQDKEFHPPYPGTHDDVKRATLRIHSLYIVVIISRVQQKSCIQLLLLLCPHLLNNNNYYDVNLL